MASACIHKQDLGKVIKYIHPNIVSPKKAAFTFFHLITDVVIGTETKLQKRYSITEENSVLFQSILFVGDQLKEILRKSFQGSSNKISKELLTRHQKLIYRTNAKLFMNSRKSFFYYLRLSVSEGLDTNKLQMNLEHFDKDIFKKYTYCHQVFAIKNNLKKDKKTCNACVKLLEKEVKHTVSFLQESVVFS